MEDVVQVQAVLIEAASVENTGRVNEPENLALDRKVVNFGFSCRGLATCRELLCGRFVPIGEVVVYLVLVLLREGEWNRMFDGLGVGHCLVQSCKLIVHAKAVDEH